MFVLDLIIALPKYHGVEDYFLSAASVFLANSSTITLAALE